LEKFRGAVLIHRIGHRKLERDSKHPQTIGGHPACSIRLIDSSAGGERCASIENTDIIETKKPSLKNIFAIGIFSIDPPGKIQQEFVKNSFEKRRVLLSRLLRVDLVHTPRRPRVNRGVYVLKGPFVGWKLSIRVHVPLARHKLELALCKISVDK